METTDEPIFIYGEEEKAYLASRDKRLAQIIEAIGHIERSVNPDLFSALINSIVGQQISAKALATVWGRMEEHLEVVTPEAVVRCSREELQRCGITFKKVDYIQNAAHKVLAGEIDLEQLHQLTDDEICRTLVTLDGIGVWTAEMLMIFSMQRMDIMSYGDLAILRGMRMVHHHRAITKDMFARYHRRYSPYASVASLYFWAVAGGAIEGMKDYAPKRKK